MSRLLAGSMLVVLLVAGCSIQSRSSEYRCEQTSDCSPERTCQDGWCVSAGPALDDMHIIDGSMSMPDALAVCPAQCLSCNGGICLIDCTGADDCLDLVVCPANLPCEVLCTGSGSCPGGVDCSQASSCDIDCDDSSACGGPITCGPGPCFIDCSSPSACTGGIDCSQSCACDTLCGGGTTCTPDPVCPGGGLCMTNRQCHSSGSCYTCS